MDSSEVIRILRHNHPPDQWAFFEELRVGGGFGKDSEQRFDAWAINYRPSKANLVRCYEIKVSKSDFNSEINKPKKRRAGLRLSNEFYFVVPAGLVKIEEVPVECGLIEVKSDGSLEVIISAPYRSTIPPTWNFLGTICRQFDSYRRKEYLEELENRKKQKQIKFACMIKLEEHIDKWKNYNLGNKQVPDIIAAELEKLKEDIHAMVDGNDDLDL